MQLLEKELLPTLASAPEFSKYFFDLAHALTESLQLDHALQLIACLAPSSIPGKDLEQFTKSMESLLNCIVAKSDCVDNGREKLRQCIVLASTWGIKVDLSKASRFDIKSTLNDIQAKEWGKIGASFAKQPQMIKPVIAALAQPCIDAVKSNANEQVILSYHKKLLEQLKEILRLFSDDNNKNDLRHQILVSMLEIVSTLFESSATLLNSLSTEMEMRDLAITLLEYTASNANGSLNAQARDSIDRLLEYTNRLIELQNGVHKLRYVSWPVSMQVKVMIAQAACASYIEDANILELVTSAFNETTSRDLLDPDNALACEHFIWKAAYQLMMRAERAQDIDALYNIPRIILGWEETNKKNTLFSLIRHTAPARAGQCNQMYMKLSIFNSAAQYHGKDYNTHVNGNKTQPDSEQDLLLNDVDAVIKLDAYTNWISQSYVAAVVFINKINDVLQNENDPTFNAELRLLRSKLPALFGQFVQNLSLVDMDAHHSFIRKITSHLLNCLACRDNESSFIHPYLAHTIFTTYKTILQAGEDSVRIFSQMYWDEICHNHAVPLEMKWKIAFMRIDLSRNKNDLKWTLEAVEGALILLPLESNTISQKFFHQTALLMIIQSLTENNSHRLTRTLFTLNQMDYGSQPVGSTLISLLQASATDPYKSGVVLGELAYLELMEQEQISPLFNNSDKEQAHFNAICSSFAALAPKLVKKKLDLLSPLFGIEQPRVVICGIFYLLASFTTNLERKHFHHPAANQMHAILELHEAHIKFCTQFNIELLGIVDLNSFNDTVKVRLACLSVNAGLLNAYSYAETVRLHSLTPSFQGDRRYLIALYTTMILSKLHHNLEPTFIDQLCQLLNDAHHEGIFKEQRKHQRTIYLTIFTNLSTALPDISKNFDAGVKIWNFIHREKIFKEKHLIVFLSKWLLPLQKAAKNDAKLLKKITDFHSKYYVPLLLRSATDTKK